MAETLKIGVIGGSGWLGGAIVQRMLITELVSSAQLTLSYRSKRPERFSDLYWTPDNQELVERSDLIIVSVRPDSWPSLQISAEGKLAVSVMAGIQLRQLEEQLKTDRVIRALPNAAAEVGKSYTPWVASPHATDSDRLLVSKVFNACGEADEVATESEIDYLTGLSGSGPAFPALLATAMMTAAEAQGIAPDIARRAVTSVLIGTGALFNQSNESPSDTVEKFINYRGATTAAINAMRAAGFDNAVGEGLTAAFQKSISMGESS